MTEDELSKKHPMYREEMTLEQEREFVKDIFTLYEDEGFSKVFWTPFSDYKNRIGQKYKVVERATEEDVDLECLPQWRIKFEDGENIIAFPEEIIPSEMQGNGCTLEL